MAEPFDEHFDRAKRALAAGWPEQALVPATEAVKLQPQRADARALLAKAWLGNRGAERALADARAALDLSPDPATVVAAHEVIARAALLAAAPADAEASLRELRKIAPSPASSAMLACVLAAADRAEDVVTVAREDAARLESPEIWDAPRIAFQALANVVEASGLGSTDAKLALGDLCWDAGLLEDARARYQAVLDEDRSNERAADGLRALADGERVRPRPRIRATVRSPKRTRFVRLAASGFGGAIAIFTVMRWEMLTMFGPFRPLLIVGGLSVVVVCVVLARRDELAAAREAEAAGTTEARGAS